MTATHCSHATGQRLVPVCDTGCIDFESVGDLLTKVAAVSTPASWSPRRIASECCSADTTVSRDPVPVRHRAEDSPSR
jgi:hypothetical protein